MRHAMSALPWIVLTILIVEFAASDHLAAGSRLQRLFVAVGAGLMAGTAVAAWTAPEAASLQHAAASAGPLLFLAVHALLRWSFRSLSGRGPIFVSPAAAAGDPSGAGEDDPDGASGASWIDYLYSFLLGVGMLLSAAGAMSVIIDGA